MSKSKCVESVAEQKNSGKKARAKVFKTIYKDVKIPWFFIILGGIFAVFNSIVILSQYENYMAIFTGSMTNLSPLFSYLAASFVQYLLIFAGVITDISLVTIVTGVRKNLWKKVLRLPLSEIENDEPSGVLSRITADAEFSAKPFSAVIAVLQITLYLISMGAAAPKDIPQALVILLITLALAVFSIVVAVKALSKSTTNVQNKISSLTNHYSEQLSGIKFVKACNAEEKAKFSSFELIDKRYQAALQFALATGLQTLSNNFTYVIMYSCAFLGGIIAIRQGTITDITPVSAIYAFGMALELTFVAIMTLPSYFASTVGGTKKIAAILQSREEKLNVGDVKPSSEADIMLNDLSFAYDKKTVIKNLTATIPQGKITAIVGANGSGKTTLIKLISRLYPSSSGEIMLGNASQNDVSLKNWRDQFGVVSQNTALFSGTIRSNICYGVDRDVADEELSKAVALSNLEEVVEGHEGGIDCAIGVKGIGLSGGEQQRVAIARALVKNPQILILDEATANLDAKTEDKIKCGLSELMKGRTVIQIAHKYSAIKDADNLIVLDNGEVIASGSPSEVENNCEFYRKLVASYQG